jgi:wyosine [tRNA(Phe)-imidazoG37] synthetase (radical SAM superfamily)
MMLESPEPEKTETGKTVIDKSVTDKGVIEMMKYVYGPIPSRRLGQSLGVDPIPLKTCNWNCVYCQLGRSVPLTNTRDEYVPREEVIEQIRQTLESHEPGEIDYISFVGSGEPTLHSSLGWMIRQVKAMTDIPVAVITNGSLLYRPEVRNELAAADVVMPTIVAGNEELYRRINRPHPEITFGRIVEGLMTFRQEYIGRLWVEIMLIKGLNDTVEALRELATALRSVQPDEVHITLPTRPPSETWVEPPDEESIMRATAIFGDIAHVVHPDGGDFDLSGYANVVDAVIGIITRHPMSQSQLKRSLTLWAPAQVDQALAQLAAGGRAKQIVRLNRTFWTATSSFFPDEEQSLATVPDVRSSQLDRADVATG